MGNYQRFKRIIILSIAFIFGLFIAVAQANTSDFPWDFMNVDIEVESNGDMLVTETQKYIFNSNHTNERYRYIPLNKVDDIKDVTVEENGEKISSTTGKKNNQFWIRWRHPLNPPENHTFVLKYRVIGGLHLDNQNTQVYWKAIFANRKSPIQNATVKVHLPESLAGKVISYKSFGTGAVSRQLDSTTFEFVANGPLSPGKELEVKVTFPTAILQVPKPTWQKITQTWSLGDIISTILALVFLLMFAYFLLWLPLIASYCPKCSKFGIQRTNQVLTRPTYSSKGKRKVTEYCQNCSYHNEYEETIPVRSHSTSGGDYGGGGGGGDGGGGGGDGGGGGGGG